MAIYHLRLKVLSRSLGRAPKPGGVTRRSAVAAAAYRSGERLYDQSQGRWFKFDKPDVIHSEILIPVNDNVPEWVLNRQTLWNRVEAAEKRVDAQLSREVEVTLPRELGKDQQVALVRAFVNDHFVRHGMVADVNIHRPMAADGLDQPHAHIMLCLRRLDFSSPTGFSSKKERDWNEREDIAREVAEARKRFNDTGLDVDKAALDAAEAKRNVNIWREQWAIYANRALADAGSASRIDHRTLEKQGIFRPAEIALGVARHIEKAYDYIKERVTQWISIRKRAQLYADTERIKARDPAALTAFVAGLNDMAESFAAQFRKPTDRDSDREVAHDR